MSLDVETQQEEMQIEAAEVTPSHEAESDRLFVEAHEEIEMLPATYDVRAEMDINDRLRADFEKIPDTMAFKIGDAADLVGVKTYVLRFWESEFEALRPKKSRNGQRVYSRRDLETAMMIRKLLYDDKFSIEGARAALLAPCAAAPPPPPSKHPYPCPGALSVSPISGCFWPPRPPAASPPRAPPPAPY
jgi:hypothetical protein